MKLTITTIFVLLVSLLFTACTNRAETSYPEKPPTQVAPTSKKNILDNCVDIRQPTPNSNETSLFPPIQMNEHILGKTGAFVTILVYSDFQCGSCAEVASLLKSFVEKYPQDVRVVFRNFPLLSIHDKAAISAQAAESAGLQGKFWEMHDFLFSNQAQWLDKNPEQFLDWITDHAIEIGIDSASFRSDITNPAIKSIVQKSWGDGQKINLPGVPIILINGEIIKWQPNLLGNLENLVKLTSLQQKQFSTCPPIVLDPQKKYSAVLHTSKGIIKINLFSEKAPNTVNNFIFLAKKGWFDNIPFHLVVEGLFVQTGDPSGTGLGGPGYLIPSEHNSLIFDRAGMVAMANSGPDTNGSQFFISLAPASNLNKDYPIFGEVTSGMEILSSFKPRNPSESTETETLISVTIEEK